MSKKSCKNDLTQTKRWCFFFSLTRSTTDELARLNFVRKVSADGEKSSLGKESPIGLMSEKATSN